MSNFFENSLILTDHAEMGLVKEKFLGYLYNLKKYMF